MSDGSWPPRVRESTGGARPRIPAPEDEPAAYGTPSTDEVPETSAEARSYAPEPAEPGTPESIGAVDHEETRVRRKRSRREHGSDDDGDADDEEDRPDRRRLITGLLIAGLVIMTACAATFLALWLADADVSGDDVRAYLDDQRPQIEERARTAVDILINYDASTIDERRQEMLEIATGNFRDDYEEFAPTLSPVLKKLGASSRGAILEEPLVSFISPEEAEVTVRAEQIAQTRENPSGRKVSYIMRLGVINTQGGWKIDKIEILSEEEA